MEKRSTFSKKETVESQSEKKNSSKSQDSSSFYDRMKNGLGVASIGAYAALKVTTAVFAVQSGFGIGRVEGFSAPGNGTELQALCDYNLSKVPEHFVQKDQLDHNEKQMQVLRDVVATAKENPEFARKLLAKVRGQERRQLDDECPVEVTCPDCRYPYEKLTVQGFFDKFSGKRINFDNCCSGNQNCQCVDLAQEYNRDVVGANQNQELKGNAVDIWDDGNFPATLYTKIANTPTNFPNEGDIVIWNTSIGPYGHIAVCQSADVNKFTSFDQNWPSESYCHPVQHDYTDVIGWLRPTKQ